MNDKCDIHGTELHDDCRLCGAPVCCEICCNETMMQARIAHLEAVLGDTRREFNRLLIIMNAVTCSHRHGSPIRDKHLTEMSNLQIECEDFLSGTPPQSTLPISTGRGNSGDCQSCGGHGMNPDGLTLCECGEGEE